MPSYWAHDGYSGLDQLGAKVAHLLHTVFDVGVVHSLAQPAGKRFHVAPGHPAIAGHALVHYYSRRSLPVDLFLVSGQEPAHVDNSVFLAAHGATVRVGEHLMNYRSDSAACISRFALFDEVRILHTAGGVEDDSDFVLLGHLVYSLEVGHAHRLAPGHVDGDGNRYVRDLVGADLLDQRLVLGEVDIALERHAVKLRIVCLVNDDVNERAAVHLLVSPCSSEVHVARHVRPGPYEDLRNEVLCSPSLVSRADILEPEQLAYSLLQVKPVFAPSVGLVAHHQTSPLPIAHGIRSAVGQEIDVHIPRLEQKRVEAGFPDPPRAFFLGKKGDGFDHLDLVRLGQVLGHCASFLPIQFGAWYSLRYIRRQYWQIPSTEDMGTPSRRKMHWSKMQDGRIASTCYCTMAAANRSIWATPLLPSEPVLLIMGSPAYRATQSTNRLHR
ncbi:MAG: hypothetical protein BWY95_01820 [Bacteroidetes bacterium ADurb.BinA104]|nr:MAG: hypothetical protein BWY95_01820 [Bacteroidetes bacterium ADurb.BinA104]